MKIYSFDTKKQKMVLCGQLIADTFFRDVKPIHFMKRIGGYGISEDAFQQIIQLGCQKFVIKEINTRKRWESKVTDWMIHCKIADYGSGTQRFLSLKYMKARKYEN